MKPRLSKRVSALDIETRATKSEVPFFAPPVPGKLPRHFNATERAKMSRYESVTTYEPQTTIYKDHLEYRSREPRWFIWVFVLAVGVLTAAAAVVMVSCMHALFAIRMRLLQFGLAGFDFGQVPAIYDNDHQLTSEAAVFSGQDVHLFGLPTHNYFGGFLMYLIFSLLMITAASILCALVPNAVGPGSPEVLAYLNGVENPAFADTRVFAAKFLATMFTVASGLPLGMYGTLAQCGTMIATSLLERSKLMRFDAIRVICCFRNPRDRRIITVIGAACGFASSFSVSIGGLMLVMEQLSTIFPVRFALYVFVGCLVSSLSVETYFSYLSYFGDRDRSAFSAGQLISEVLIQFDTKVRGIMPVPMNVLVFFPAIFIGGVCGLLSVAYGRINHFALTLRRRLEQRVNSKGIRFLMPIAAALLYSVLSYWVGVAFGNSIDGAYGCQPLPANGTIMATRSISVVSYYGMDGMLCEPYIVNKSDPLNPTVVPQSMLPALDRLNSTAAYSAPPLMHTYSSLSFGFADSTLQMLLSWRTASTFPAGVVFVYGCIYFVVSAFASGISLTGDVMLPVMVIGACVGRLVGIAIYQAWNAMGMSGETWTDPGAFALIGAGCMFGGSTGMTFSICVILTEITNDFRHVLPLMLGISVAKRIAEKFTRNVNTAYLETRCVPLLDFDARIHKYDMFCAKHVMTPYVVILHTVSSIEEVLQTLQSCSHNAFPVESVRDGTFKGIILRQQLLLYLWHLHLTDSHSGINHEQLQRVEDTLYYEGYNKDCPYPPFEDYWLADRIDLSAHIDQSGFCVLDTTSISRTYHMFRTLGLRHLVVVNRDNRIVGIVTRKDLVTDNIVRRITTENEHRRKQLQALKRRQQEEAFGQVAESDDEDDLDLMNTMQSFRHMVAGKEEWIVVDEGQEGDAPSWEGGGLGPMHPNMCVDSVSGPLTNSRNTSMRDHPDAACLTKPANPRMSAILKQVPSTASVDEQSQSSPDAALESSASRPPRAQTAPESIHRRTNSLDTSNRGKFGRVLRPSSSKGSLDNSSDLGAVPGARRPVVSFGRQRESSTPPAALTDAPHAVDDADVSSCSSEDSVEILRQQQKGPFESPRSNKKHRRVLVVSPLQPHEEAATPPTQSLLMRPKEKTTEAQPQSSSEASMETFERRSETHNGATPRGEET